MAVTREEFFDGELAPREPLVPGGMTARPIPAPVATDEPCDPKPSATKTRGTMKARGL